MKQIRIFLIRTLTSALFMAAYYLQEKMRGENIRDICIIHWEAALNNHKGEIGIRNKIFTAALKKSAALISEEIIIFPEQDIEYIPMSFKDMCADREKKIKYLDDIRNIFKENDIPLQSIIEVYHSNKILHQYIKYLCPKAKLIGFEHSIHEIKRYFLRYNPLCFIKNYIKTVLGSVFFVFYRYAECDNLSASLFAQRIAKVNKRMRLIQIQNQYIKEAARKVAEDDLKDKTFLDGCGSIVIVLVSNGYEFAKNKDEVIKFHKEFAIYFKDVLKNTTLQINTVIFKARPYDECFDKVKGDFRHCFNDYNVFFFDEISKINYPIEFYLDFIKPKAMFGDTSSGLFYSKAQMPQIQTYTFHEYIIQYQRRHFGEISRDYGWIIDIFYKKYFCIFSDIAPKIIKFG